MTHQIARCFPRRRLGALALATGLAALFALGGCRSVSDRSIEVVGLSEVQRTVQRDNGKSTLIVDARPATEFEAGHIPGAVNLRPPDIDLEDPDPALSKYKAILVYGEDPGSASAKAMTKLFLRAKYKNVRMFSGGMQAWRGAGLPVESGPAR